MKKKISKVILLLESSREYDRGLLRGITKYAQAHGPWNIYMMPSYFIRSKISTRKNEFRRLKDWGAEGVIAREIIPLDDILWLELPTIISSHSQKIVDGVSNIVADNIQIGQIAAEHLLDRGFKHFAFCDYSDFFWSRERHEGFRSRIEEAGYTVDYYQWPKSKAKRLWINEQPIMTEWLKTLPKPVGIMACVDERSRDVNEACKAAGFYVPEEVAIVGGNNDEFLCKLSDPPFSSVAIDVETAGYNAAHHLSRLMNREIHNHQVIQALPTHVVCRASTNITAIDDPDIVKAINYIRQNAGRPIQVRDVVEHTGMGRTVLYIKFRTIVGRSIQQEIKIARIEKIISMLINSKSSIGQIAFEIGMNPEHLCRYFASAKGISPEAFRQKYSKK